MNNKGQTTGMIIGLVMGVASLVIAAIIAFVIVSTLTGADLLTATRTTYSATNESGGYINETGYTLTGASGNYVSGSFSITTAHNVTDDAGTVILSGNYTVSAAGVVTNATVTTWPAVNFTYTNTVQSVEEQASDKLSSNFSEGVHNISSKIPTVLLIAAIILILAMLAILVGVWQRMRMGGGAGL